MKYFRFRLKLIWFIACFTGSIYQIGQTSDQFLKYETVTTISIKFPDIFIAPAISDCFFEVELIEWEKLIELKPKIKKDLNISANEGIVEKIQSMTFVGKRKFQGILFEKLDIKTRSEITASFEELFRECSITNPEDGATLVTGHCTELFDVVSYKFTYYTRFQFNLKMSNYSI